MLLSPGTRLGAYEIQSALGAGGMGEVYRAKDTRLDRIVAIKVMPTHIAQTPELRQRFEREARTIASLSHPHICTLHDVGRHEAVDYLVMEFLDGQTLEERLREGPLPLQHALKIAVQIAEALATAHQAGVIHRDLKPGNIMLVRRGGSSGAPDAMLLDFGLAKTGGPAVAGGLSMLPTSPPNLTAEGSILGTFQYMAPEQLEGQEADARTDIFAFGAVLYEMLTGTKAFEGKSQASLIGAILKDTPAAVSTRQPLAPAALDRVIATCLAKDPADRWQSAHDIMLQLRWIADGSLSTIGAAVAVAQPRRREMLAWAAAVGCLVAGITTFGSRYFESPEAESGAVRFDVDVPTAFDTTNAGFFAVSPDGRRVVYEAQPTTNSRSLWVRSLDSAVAQPLPGTDSGTALNPFWSPDSRFVGFFADGKLKTISISGGPPRTLCDAPSDGSGTWSHDGVILFGSAIASGKPVHRVPDTGGEPVAVTMLDRTPDDVAHVFPHFLPDGRHFLFLAASSDADKGVIYVGALDSTDTRLVESVASSVAYAPPGYLLFARNGTLMARSFDASRQESTGEPAPLTEVRQGGNRLAAFSVSLSGVLAYQAPVSSEGQLVWLTRDGKVVGSFPPRGGIHAFWLAPDQEHAAVEQGNDVWLLDSARGTSTRFTTDPLQDGHPVWSPDGRRIAFFNGPPTVSTRLMLKAATGISEAEPIVQSPNLKWFTDWSSDGRTLVFEEQNRDTGWDISVVSVDGDRTPRPVIQSRFQEHMGSLSPDGRYLAYTSDETGRTEVYVVTFPVVSDKWAISTSGGTAPRWRQDGSELFFVDLDGTLMSVPLARGDKFGAGVAKPLFELRAVPTDGWNYAVSADGQRILAARSTDTATTAISVVVNWTALLNR